MKTKHLLTALALPAIFAACTADDIETVGVNSVERVALNENFKLNFGGVESRMTAGKPGEALSITFEANDEVGGAIVDTYDGTNYEVVDYVSTNHPFVYDGATWNIEHTMVEGNYLFYYPYNENNHSRSAAAYSIPVMQDLSDKVTGEFNPKAAVEKYAMAVGHQFLNKEDLSASVELAPIFSYARLVLKLDNTYAGGEVDKIVLQSTSDFELNGQISNTKVSEIFEAIADAKDEDAIAAIWAENKQTKNFALETSEKAPNAYYKGDLNKTSKVMVGKVPAGVSLKVDAQNNKTFETYMVMPAQSILDLTVYLYMNDGRVFMSDKASFTDGLIFNRNTPKKVEASMVKADKVPYIVTSEKDWNEYVSLMGKEGAEFIIAGNDFTVTNTTKYPTAKEAIITVKSALKVTGNNVTMKNIVATENVTVEKGAVLNTDKTATYTTITNKGTLNVTKVVDADGDVETYAAGEIINEAGATLNVNDKAAVSMKLNNKIDVKTKELNHGVVVNNGTITFDENSQNSGKITNNGSLTGSLTNAAKYEFKNAAQKVIAEFTPIITNNGEIFASDAWNNNGKIINAKDAEITVSKFGSAAFNNAGVMNLADGSHCLITDNAGGELILATLNQSGWAVENANGTIAYSTQASDAGKAYDFETTGKGITKIYVNGNLGITKKGALTEVVVKKNATLNMPKGETIAELTICEDVDVIVNAYDKDNAANVTALVVEEGATLTINKENTFNCSTVENEGTVYVGGSFAAAETTKGDAEKQTGKYKTTATTGSISFNGQTAAEKEEAKMIAAYKIVVDAVIEVDANLTTWAATETRIKALNLWNASNADVKEAMEDFVEAYNKLVDEDEAIENKEADIKEAFAAKNADNETYLGLAVAAAKAVADDNVATIVKAIYKDNTWFGANVVYTKSASDAKFNTISNGTTLMYKDFADKVAGITKEQVIAEEYNYGDWMSVAAVTEARYWDGTTAINGTEIPAYSYIENYEGSYLYKVLKLMQEFTYTAPTSNAEKWQSMLAWVASNKEATIEGVISFYNEVYKIYKDADAKLTDDLVLGPKVKAIADEAATVVTWKYTTAQIQKAVVDGEFGTKLQGGGAQFYK